MEPTGLRIQHCHYCSSGYHSGAGLVPGPGTSACCRTVEGEGERGDRERERYLMWTTGFQKGSNWFNTLNMSKCSTHCFKPRDAIGS